MVVAEAELPSASTSINEPSKAIRQTLTKYLNPLTIDDEACKTVCQIPPIISVSITYDEGVV